MTRIKLQFLQSSNGTELNVIEKGQLTFTPNAIYLGVGKKSIKYPTVEQLEFATSEKAGIIKPEALFFKIGDQGSLSINLDEGSSLKTYLTTNFYLKTEIDGKVTTLNEKDSQLDSEITALKTKITQLEEKITQLERRL